MNNRVANVIAAPGERVSKDVAEPQIWTAVTCHSLEYVAEPLSNSSPRPTAPPKKSGSAANQSGDKSPHSKMIEILHCGRASKCCVTGESSRDSVAEVQICVICEICG